MGCSCVACTRRCWSFHHWSSLYLWLGRSKVHPVTISWVLPLSLSSTTHFERLLLPQTPIINVYAIKLICKVTCSLSLEALASTLWPNINFRGFGACKEASCWPITFGEGSIYHASSTTTTTHATSKIVGRHYSLRGSGAKSIRLCSSDAPSICKVVI